MRFERSRRAAGSEPRFPDAASFASVLPEHDDYLRGIVWAVVRDPDVLDDVMQSAYEKAYRSIATFDGRSSLRTWLHSICYRTAIDHLRYESRRRHGSLESVGTEPVSPAHAERSDEVVNGMEAADVLARLDPEQRAMLYLTAGLGYSYDEVAEIVGMPRGTVASQVSRAKDRIRKGTAS